MLLLLCILLHLQLITGPGVYQESEITNLEATNQSQISAIENDPVMAETVYDEYNGIATQIVVVDDKEDP